MIRSVIILARGVQASRLGAYGAAWSLTPNMDRLASQSLVLDRFLRTTTSRNSWGKELVEGPTSGIWATNRIGLPFGTTGLTPSALPGDSGPEFEKCLANTVNTWKKGNFTWLVLDLGDALPPWTPDSQDLEAYFPANSRDPIAVTEGDETNSASEKGETIEDDEPKDLEPWLTTIEELTRNSQPASATPIRERLLLTHASAIATLDRKVGVILDLLADDPTADFHIFLTSDGGIGVGDKIVFGDSPETPWLDLIQVPFFWCHPSRTSVGQRSLALVSDRDLFDLLNKGVTQGPNALESCWHLPRNAGHDHVVTNGRNGAKAVRNANFGLVMDPKGDQRLYHFPLDHWEMNDVGSQNPAEVAALAQILKN